MLSLLFSFVIVLLVVWSPFAQKGKIKSKRITLPTTNVEK